MGRPKIQSEELLKKYIDSPQLSISQKLTLKRFKAFISEEKKGLTPRYIYDVFRQAHDFGVLINKPYEDVVEEDFKNFYNSAIGEKGVQQITIEGYENRLKVLYSFVFAGRENYEKYSNTEKTIKSIFKQRLIEERRKLNEADIDNNGKIKAIERYIGDGIRRQVYKNEEFVGYEQVSLSEPQRVTLTNYYKRLRSGTFCKTGVHNLHRTIGFLFKFGEFTKKPYEKTEGEDFVNFFFKLETENKSIATIDGYKHILKVFYTHFLQKEDLVKNIALSKKRIKKKESEMLSPAEIRELVVVCSHPRDKCLLMVTYDGAFRQGEGLGIKLKDVESDEHGYKITVSGKTGTRKVRLIDAVPYLNDWINYHPFKNDPEAYLFINLKTYGRKLKENGIAQIFNRAKKLAGFTKRVYPHLLRHSRLNQLAKEGFNERDLRIFAGWSSDSKMPDTYIHYDERHVDKKMLESRGIFTDENKQKIEEERKMLEPKKCPRCQKINPADAFYCNCGMVLNPKEALQLDNLKKEVNGFTEELMNVPIPKGTDANSGVMEMLFQAMLSDQQMLQKFKQIMKKMNDDENKRKLD